jgi:hypothetical protein
MSVKTPWSTLLAVTEVKPTSEFGAPIGRGYDAPMM